MCCLRSGEILEQLNWVKWLGVDSEPDIPKIQSAAPLNISALKWYFGVKTVQMFHFNHDKLFLQDNDISYSCTILIFKFDICIFEGIFTSWLEKFYQNVNWADGERVKKIYTVQNIGFCQISIRVKTVYIVLLRIGTSWLRYEPKERKCLCVRQEVKRVLPRGVKLCRSFISYIL